MRALLGWALILLGGLPLICVLATASSPQRPVLGPDIGSLVLFGVILLPIAGGAWLLQNERRAREVEEDRAVLRREEQRLIPGFAQGEALGVKILPVPARESCEIIGDIEVEVITPTARSSVPPPDLGNAIQALRNRAAEVGANAVVGVQYTRISPKFWSFRPEHRLKARGAAVRLEADQLASVTPKESV
jgi:hypothetical protein